jgi:hypothetical protein
MMTSKSTKYDAFRRLFEPENGWADDATAREAFAVFERERNGMPAPAKDPVRRVEMAQLAVADAAKDLDPVRGVRVQTGVVVTLESWRELQDALAEWRTATEAFLLAQVRS